MTTTQWGRRETIVTPPRAPVYTYGSLLLAFLSTCLACYLWTVLAWSRLERFYLPVYIKTTVVGAFQRESNYRLPTVTDVHGKARPAIPADVEPGSTPQADGRPLPLILSESARATGLVRLDRGDDARYRNQPLHMYLRRFVYDGMSVPRLFLWPALIGLGVPGFLLYFAVRMDIERLLERKYGRVLKGPRLVSPGAFNRAVKGDGVGFKTIESRRLMRIPKRVEGQHIEIMGDTGAGKTRLIMQLLLQIRERGHSAIIYDPACEFVQRFYDPKRDDIILNPLDARCPYWGPAEELRRRAEAKAIAASLYQPTTDKKGEFFVETPQKIFAHLLTFGPTPQELVDWMANPDEIDRRVQRTEMASMIAKGAQQQRNGVLASLGLIADSLRLLPTKEKAERTWSATEWSDSRKGWIFLTSKPSEREALRPLHSLWIDLLVLRLLNEPKGDQHPVWFVLDELASLQRLPQLHTAITENRKSKNPLVLGFQGRPSSR